MVSETTKQWLEILDLKNEIENLKLIISGVKVSIGYSKNKNQTTKLKQKVFTLSRRLKDLNDKKSKLEKEYALVCKTERKVQF